MPLCVLGKALFAAAMASPLSLLQQQLAGLDKVATGLEYDLLVVNTQRQTLRNDIRKVVRQEAAQSVPSSQDSSAADLSDVILPPAKRTTLEEHWIEVKRERELMREVAKAESEDFSIQEEVKSEPLEQRMPERNTKEEDSICEAAKSEPSGQRMPESKGKRVFVRTPDGECPVCWRRQSNLRVGSFKHMDGCPKAPSSALSTKPLSQTCSPALRSDEHLETSAVDSSAKSSAEVGLKQRRAYVRTPPGECPACWRKAQHMAVGSSKHKAGCPKAAPREQAKDDVGE